MKAINKLLGSGNQKRTLTDVGKPTWLAQVRWNGLFSGFSYHVKQQALVRKKNSYTVITIILKILLFHQHRKITMRLFAQRYLKHVFLEAFYSPQEADCGETEIYCSSKLCFFCKHKTLFMNVKRNFKYIGFALSSAMHQSHPGTSKKSDTNIPNKENTRSDPKIIHTTPKKWIQQ